MSVGLKSRQAWLTEPGHFEIRNVEVAPGPGEVLIKVRVCGLCNWELNHWNGHIGPCPQPLGHEIAGTVVAIGDDIPENMFKIGDRVTSFSGSGFADYTVANYAKCFHLSEKVPLDEALGEPLSCVVNSVRGVAPESGDIGVVVGCGPMGLWCIQALSGGFLGSLVAVDVDDQKLELARKYGATLTINPRRESVTDTIAEMSQNHMADFVIEGTGRPDLLNGCVDYLRRGRGRLALMSSHEEGNAVFDWRPAINKGIQILVTHPPYAIDMVDNLRRATILLNQGTFSSAEIITHRFDLAQIEEAFHALSNKPFNYIKGVIDFEEHS